MKEKLAFNWKWVAKATGANDLSITLDGTTRAPNIEMASNQVRRGISEELGLPEEAIIVHKLHQVGGRA
ncbi:hypothetical protein [Vibrio sp. ER1A]|uniref:hypothetical protein n=1 Tax=Vibrio sp. ER1A TaxID=1517681 RepID=UPI0004DD293C|nr:hypothetical protein [Vibrio sp. ER1A]KFA99453.1 hypothetical protein HW45_03575 [Vibrio sp. ER1A]